MSEIVIEICAWLISLGLTLLLMCAIVEFVRLFRVGRNVIAWCIVAFLDVRCILRGHDWFYRRIDANRRFCRRCGQCERADVNSSVWTEETPRTALARELAKALANGKPNEHITADIKRTYESIAKHEHRPQ